MNAMDVTSARRIVSSLALRTRSPQAFDQIRTESRYIAATAIFTRSFDEVYQSVLFIVFR